MLFFPKAINDINGKSRSTMTFDTHTYYPHIDEKAANFDIPGNYVYIVLKPDKKPALKANKLLSNLVS